MYSLEDKKPFFHFSVDDVFDALVDLHTCRESIFEHPFFATLKRFQAAYGLTVDLYLFYQKDRRTLREVPDRFADEFRRNPWIRFGPHALDYGTSPFAQAPEDQRRAFDLVYREIQRFTGNPSGSSIVRLHYFSESFELSGYFREHGVDALCTTDKPALSYRMPDPQKRDLALRGWCRYEGLTFIRSHFRLENITRAQEIDERCASLLRDPGFVVLFTHEVNFAEPRVVQNLERALTFFKARCVLPWGVRA